MIERTAWAVVLAAALLVDLGARPALAADAPSWRIAGTRATPLRVRLVQRLRDHDAEGRARVLEVDALLADEGQVLWAGAAPVLEGRTEPRRPWTRIAAAAQTAWLTADGSPWPPAPEDSVRLPRLRATFEGDSIAAAGIDGPWRLTFATVPEGDSSASAARWYEAFTAPLRAMEFGRIDWFLRSVERLRGRTRIRVTIESSVEGRATFRLRAWPDRDGGAAPANAGAGRDAARAPAGRRVELGLKPGMNRVSLDLPFEAEGFARGPDRPLRFEVLEADTDRRLWPR